MKSLTETIKETLENKQPVLVEKSQQPVNKQTQSLSEVIEQTVHQSKKENVLQS